MDISCVKRSRILVLLMGAGVAVFLISLLCTSAVAKGGNDLFALGNEAYSAGKYDAAISYYRKVLKQEGYSTSLLYNMANAYYQKKVVGQAILHYERALYLDPGNADIQANLALARRDFGLISGQASDWQRLFELLNLNGWAILASSAFGVFSLIFLLRGIRPGFLKGTSFKLISTICILCLMAGGAGATVQFKNVHRGVVTKDNVSLLVSPFDSAASAATVKDGKVVRIAKTYRDYLLVEEVNGKSGWVKKNAIQPVVPSGERT